MVSLSWLKDGLVFTSAKFFKHQGAYTRVPQRPDICDKCDSRSGRFHAHGRYQRSLIYLKGPMSLKPLRSGSTAGCVFAVAEP